MVKGMEIKSIVFAKYLIMDILPVAESLLSEYTKYEVKELLEEYAFKYVDTEVLHLDSPRLQFVFDISDGNNVYLTKYDENEYNTDKLQSVFNYNIHLKLYPSSTILKLVDIDNRIIHTKPIERLPKSFTEIKNNVVFDNYIILNIENCKVVNYSTPEFFTDVEGIFNR